MTEQENQPMKRPIQFGEGIEKLIVDALDLADLGIPAWLDNIDPIEYRDTLLELESCRALYHILGDIKGEETMRNYMKIFQERLDIEIEMFNSED